MMINHLLMMAKYHNYIHSTGSAHQPYPSIRREKCFIAKVLIKPQLQLGSLRTSENLELLIGGKLIFVIMWNL